MYREANNPAGILVHNDHDPLAFQEKRFTTKQVNAPQAIFGVTECSELGWALKPAVLVYVHHVESTTADICD